MLDADFKMAATQKAHNLIVLCSPRYYEEDKKLLTWAQNSSRSSYTKPPLIAIDQKLLRNIFFKPGEDKRIICVVLDQDSEQRIRHVPSTYRSRPVYSFPSETEDLLQCIADVPKYSAPPPTRQRVITSTRIDYPNALKEWNAARVPRKENHCSNNSPRSLRLSEPIHQEESAHPNRTRTQNRTKKTSFIKKLLNKK